MSTEGSTKAILAALAANAGIAVAKFVGFVITGSSSMLAEAVHSVADTSNQGLLLFGQRQARKEATSLHQFGYGRSRYFYSFVVALVLFSLGSPGFLLWITSAVLPPGASLTLRTAFFSGRLVTPLLPLSPAPPPAS